ncbi:MAG: hypothetical protein H6741_09325 [Alphaproteobacteria bacterium]|nr:hypothetical protein [Alphaproteobacteria bacterium]
MPAALQRIDEVAWPGWTSRADGGRDPLLQAPPRPWTPEALQAALRQRILEAVTADPAVVRAYGSLLAVDCVIGARRGPASRPASASPALEAGPHRRHRPDDDGPRPPGRGPGRRGHRAAERASWRVGRPRRWPTCCSPEALDAVGRRDGADLQFQGGPQPRAGGRGDLSAPRARALADREDAEGAPAAAQRARTLDPSDLVAAGILLR